MEDGAGADVAGKIMTDFIKEFSGAAMVLSFMLCYVPQIMKIIKHESSKDISPIMIWLGISGYTLSLIHISEPTRPY